MKAVLNDDDLSEVASEFFAVATDDDDERDSNTSKTKAPNANFQLLYQI